MSSEGDGDWGVRKSAQYIAENSEHVSVKQEGVEELATHLFSRISSSALSPMIWKQGKLHPQESNEQAVKWIFLVDTLNFCFWFKDPSSRFVVNYKNEDFSGYWSLCAAVNRAIDEGFDLTDPNVMKSVTMDDLLRVFRSANPTASVPMIESRLNVLHEAGQVLCERYDGSILNLLKETNHSALKTIQLLGTHFTSYKDEATYKGKRVSIYKRAQIFVADVWGCFEGKGLGRFDDIDEITMFADYRVPQTLCYFKVLQYDETLTSLLKEGALLKNGSAEEVEIRGCSIHSVELILQRINALLKEKREKESNFVANQINAVLIDFYLWEYAQDHKKDMATFPIHYTKSVFY